jgi:uncharacterized protein YggE
MENKILPYAIALIAVLVFAALMVFSLEGSIGTRGSNRMLSISATGSAYNKSSEAQISVTINGTGTTSALAVQNLSSTLGRFNSTAYGFLNGNYSLLATTYYSVYKPYSYPCGVYAGGVSGIIPTPICNMSKTSNLSNYVAVEEITVTLPNISNVSSFLGAVGSIPNVYVTSTYPLLSDRQATMLRSEALAAALANATSQAKALIGNDTILSTNITVNNYYVYPYELAGAGSGISTINGNVTPTTTIGPEFYSGLNKVTESINVVFYYAGR